jgi:hypothetical protein
MNFAPFLKVTSDTPIIDTGQIGNFNNIKLFSLSLFVIDILDKGFENAKHFFSFLKPTSLA